MQEMADGIVTNTGLWIKDQRVDIKERTLDDRVYTLQEANGLIPLVSSIAEDIIRTRDEYEKISQTRSIEYALFQTMGDCSTLFPLSEEFVRLQNELYDLDLIFDANDPFSVYFFSLLDDQMIDLCWHRGDSHIKKFRKIEIAEIEVAARPKDPPYFSRLSRDSTRHFIRRLKPSAEMPLYTNPSYATRS